MKIEYYGKIKLLTGKSEETILYAAQIKDLLEVILNKYPEIKNEELMIMVNNKFVKPEFVLQPNDTVSLLSVVDGG